MAGGNGPDNASCIIWALWYVFQKFYSLIYFLTKSFFQVITTATTGTMNDKHGSGKEVDDETGPNDARRIVWALCELFNFFLHILLVISNVFLFYLSSTSSTYV